jgi:hypothetical protein
MSDDFFFQILFLHPAVFDDKIDCCIQQFFVLRRYVIFFQYNLLLQIYSNSIIHLGPDFKSWWQIGGAAQMCSYLCPTH